MIEKADLYFLSVILLLSSVAIFYIRYDHYKAHAEPPRATLISSTFFLGLSPIVVFLSPESLFNHYPGQLSFIVGLVLTLSLGSLSPIILSRAVKSTRFSKPNQMDEADWNELSSALKSGDWVGRLERVLFFIALAVSPALKTGALFIGGLLTFKLGAKWEAWKNIVQIPKRRPRGFPNELSYFIFKRQWGSRLLTRFLVGTFSNILFAIIGYAVYGWSLKILAP